MLELKKISKYVISGSTVLCFFFYNGVDAIQFNSETISEEIYKGTLKEVIPSFAECSRVTSPILYFHTYIIDYFNPSVSITTYLLTPLMLCALILYISGGTYSLNFMAILFRFCQTSAEKEVTEEIFSYFRFDV